MGELRVHLEVMGWSRAEGWCWRCDVSSLVQVVWTLECNDRKSGYSVLLSKPTCVQCGLVMA